MKRIVYFAMITVMAFSVLTACTKKNEATAQAETTASAAALANPWTDTDYQGMKDLTGLDLNIPEYAENIVYRVNAGENMAEVQFTIKETGTKCTARVKPTGTAEDITGAYYKWENEEEVNIGRCSGKMGTAKNDQGMIQYCTWYDMVPGISYSLVVQDKDLDGFDITAVAADLFKPMQNDAG